MFTHPAIQDFMYEVFSLAQICACILSLCIAGASLVLLPFLGYKRLGFKSAILSPVLSDQLKNLICRGFWLRRVAHVWVSSDWRDIGNGFAEVRQLLACIAVLHSI